MKTLFQTIPLRDMKTGYHKSVPTKDLRAEVSKSRSLSPDLLSQYNGDACFLCPFDL